MCLHFCLIERSLYRLSSNVNFRISDVGCLSIVHHMTTNSWIYSYIMRRAMADQEMEGLLSGFGEYLLRGPSTDEKRARFSERRPRHQTEVGPIEQAILAMLKDRRNEPRSPLDAL